MLCKSKNLHVGWGGLCNKGCWHSPVLPNRGCKGARRSERARRWASIQVPGDVVMAKETPMKVSPETPHWSPDIFSFALAALGSGEMHFPRKAGRLATGDPLRAVNPGNAVMLCHFSLSVSLEIWVIYGSFLHKAGTGGLRCLSLKEAKLSAKAAGGFWLVQSRCS